MIATATSTAESTRHALLRVKSLTGAIYDDLGAAGIADPTNPVFAELAGQLDEMRATVRRGLGEAPAPTDD